MLRCVTGGKQVGTLFGHKHRLQSVGNSNEREYKMAYGIDEILSMLCWSRPKDEQLHGIELAKDVKCINAFLQPGPPYGKPVWDNCAVVLSKKSNQELAPYVYPLLVWLQDINWPGAILIYQRLLKFEDIQIQYALGRCIFEAKMLKDDEWMNMLLKLKDKVPLR